MAKYRIRWCLTKTKNLHRKITRIKRAKQYTYKPTSGIISRQQLNRILNEHYGKSGRNY
jgi:hypothetical protein